jgi:phage uncharacterized protein TIGR01671
MIPKLKAWDSYDEKVVEVLSIDFEDKIAYVEQANGDRYDIHFDNLQFMESTGLKDKNGIEIFEGYLVKHDEGEYSYIGSVKKDCYQFYIDGIEPVDSFDFVDVSNTFDGTTSLTIIGNTYENPELLEGKK